MVHVGSKTRSLGQIFENPCVSSRCQILRVVPMELDNSVCIDKISNMFVNG